jgi:hypothetical protein
MMEEEEEEEIMAKPAPGNAGEKGIIVQGGAEEKGIIVQGGAVGIIDDNKPAEFMPSTPGAVAPPEPGMPAPGAAQTAK